MALNEGCRELLEISQQRKISPTQRTKNALDDWKHISCVTLSTMNLFISTNRKRMADETLDGSRRLATTNTGIDIGMIVSEEPWSLTSLRILLQ